MTAVRASEPGVGSASHPRRAWLEASAQPEFVSIRAGNPPEGAPKEARSYLGDGRLVAWRPPQWPDVACAIDAELVNNPVPQALHRRFPVLDRETFWRRWTRLEVCCKVTDTPLLTWLAGRGLDTADAPVLMTTEVMGDIVLTFGVARDG